MLRATPRRRIEGGKGRSRTAPAACVTAATDRIAHRRCRRRGRRRHRPTLAAVLKLADEGIYEAKRRGKGVSSSAS